MNSPRLTLVEFSPMRHSAYSASSDFPNEIADVIEALSEVERRRILIILQYGPLPYTKLRELTEQTKGNLNSHLNRLEAAGLIRNFTLGRRTHAYRSFYELTRLAMKIVDGIFAAFRPLQEQQELGTIGSATFSIVYGGITEVMIGGMGSTVPGKSSSESVPISAAVKSR